MPEDPTKDPQANGDKADEGKKDDAVQLKKDDSALGQLVDQLGRMETKLGKIDKLEQDMNLIQTQVLSPDHFAEGEKPKPTKAALEGDEAKTKGLDDYDWEGMTNKEIVAVMSSEYNRVLKDMDKGYSKDRDDLKTEIDVIRTITTIADKDKTSWGEAEVKFWKHEDEMLKLADKYPNMSPRDAYKIASGEKLEPTPKKSEPEGKEGKDRIDPKALATELRGGGAKPGGVSSDLSDRPGKTTRETVTKKYDELFPEKS